jgi:hypothetical protein
MQPDAHKPDQPKKPVIKNWVPQAKRTADSVKKLKKGVDQLKPWAVPPWGKQPHRTEIPTRILPILRGLKRRPTSREAILHALTASLFENAFSHAPGSKINLGDAWQQVLYRFQHLRPDVVQWLNSSESKSAFIWQIAGHLNAFSHPFKDNTSEVFIVQMTRGPRKGESVPCTLSFDGNLIEIPQDWQPDWPIFLCAGDYWQQQPVCHYTVVNMSFSWPCPAVEEILKIILWEPPLRVFKVRNQKKQC